MKFLPDYLAFLNAPFPSPAHHLPNLPLKNFSSLKFFDDDGSSKSRFKMTSFYQIPYSSVSLSGRLI